MLTRALVSPGSRKGDGKTVVRGSIGQYSAPITSGDWYSPPPEVPAWSTYWLNWDNEWELI